jgi:hypothetical protein
MSAQRNGIGRPWAFANPRQQRVGWTFRLGRLSITLSWRAR